MKLSVKLIIMLWCIPCFHGVYASTISSLTLTGTQLSELWLNPTMGTTSVTYGIGEQRTTQLNQALAKKGSSISIEGHYNFVQNTYVIKALSKSEILFSVSQPIPSDKLTSMSALDTLSAFSITVQTVGGQAHDPSGSFGEVTGVIITNTGDNLTILPKRSLFTEGINAIVTESEFLYKNSNLGISYGPDNKQEWYDFSQSVMTLVKNALKRSDIIGKYGVEKSGSVYKVIFKFYRVSDGVLIASQTFTSKVKNTTPVGWAWFGYNTGYVDMYLPQDSVVLKRSIYDVSLSKDVSLQSLELGFMFHNSQTKKTTKVSAPFTPDQMNTINTKMIAKGLDFTIGYEVLPSGTDYAIDVNVTSNGVAQADLSLKSVPLLTSLGPVKVKNNTLTKSFVGYQTGNMKSFKAIEASELKFVVNSNALLSPGSHSAPAPAPAPGGGGTPVPAPSYGGGSGGRF